MNEQTVTFKSDGLTLEGRLAAPESDAPMHGAVVCHPHPLYGGSMDNNVVRAILESLWALGFATLRFNFRGVGRSEGKHGGGGAEIEDAIAAVRFLSEQPGLRKDGIVLAGYSFGARVSVIAAPRLAEVAAVVAVALPVSVMEPPDVAEWDKPLVLIAGDRDSFCKTNDLEAFHRKIARPSTLKLIAGADHFFAGFEAELSGALTSALSDTRFA
ncbi:MAG: dienelactone hydrolase family protein [Candidatus Binataceae bacterium]|nr:dienelactone hydrolase family protein [Candidatus Binataceae bacterium]